MRYLRLVLRVLLGLFFMGSAVAKLVAIDDFELYVFSYGFLSLNLTFVAVRLCIAAELALGAMIALGWWPRTVRLMTVAMLAAFSIFLLYAGLVGRNENCQCMGRVVELNPWQSLIKNALLVLVTFFVYHGSHDNGLKWRRWVAAALVAAALVVPFTVSIPDSWMFGPDEAYYDAELLGETLAERHLDEGHYMVAFVTPGCPYCRMSRSKIGSIVERHGLDSTRVVYLEPDDIGQDRFLKITYGQRPMIFLLDNGKPQMTFHYRNIDERRLAEFLQVAP